MSGAGFDCGLLDRLDPVWRLWLELRGQVGSTNDLARARARGGAGHGTTVAAGWQTAGRGRKGAAWHCPPGGGLAFSVVLRPRLPRALWPRLSLVAGLAVAVELERLGLAARIKWPNDVLVGRRKLSGVLVEAEPGWAVVGIGLNVNVERFPPPLEQSATSVRLELGRPVERESLLVGIRTGLLQWLDQASTDFAGVLEALGERCALRGTAIRATTGHGPVAGIGCGFGPGGELLIDDHGHLIRLLQADDVRLSDDP